MTTDPDADTLLIVIAGTTVLICLICMAMAVRRWKRESDRYIASRTLNQHKVTPLIPRDFKVRK